MSKFRQFLDSVQYQQAVSQLKESFAAAQDLITDWAIQGVENTMLKGELKGTPFNELSRHHKLTLLASNVDWERYTKLGMDESTPLKIMFNAIDGKPPEQWLEQTPEEAKSRNAEIDNYGTAAALDEIEKSWPKHNYDYFRSTDGVDDVYRVWNMPEDREVCSIHFWDEPDTDDAAKALVDAKELVAGLNNGKITEAQALEQNPPVEWVEVSAEDRKMHIEKSKAALDDFEQDLAQAASRGKTQEKDRGLEME